MPKIISDMKMMQDPRMEFPEAINEIENYMPKLEFWTCIYSTDFLKKKNIRFFEYKNKMWRQLLDLENSQMLGIYL